MVVRFHFNNVLTSTPRSSKRFLIFRFYDKNLVCLCHLSCSSGSRPTTKFCSICSNILPFPTCFHAVVSSTNSVYQIIGFPRPRLQPWRWRQHTSPKRWLLPISPHGDPTQKNIIINSVHVSSVYMRSTRPTQRNDQWKLCSLYYNLLIKITCQATEGLSRPSVRLQAQTKYFLQMTYDMRNDVPAVSTVNDLVSFWLTVLT
jgi:hypothetical protein